MMVLAKESQRLLILSGEPLREAVNRLIPTLSVDMETKEVELTIALPVWATAIQGKRGKTATNGQEEVCLPTSLQSSTGGWTQVTFITATCQYLWLRGSRTTPPCYTCQRKAA